MTDKRQAYRLDGCAAIRFTVTGSKSTGDYDYDVKRYIVPGSLFTIHEKGGRVHLTTISIGDTSGFHGNLFDRIDTWTLKEHSFDDVHERLTNRYKHVEVIPRHTGSGERTSALLDISNSLRDINDNLFQLVKHFERREL